MIDPETVEPVSDLFFDARKRLPELFGEKRSALRAEDIATQSKLLNEEIETTPDGQTFEQSTTVFLTIQGNNSEETLRVRCLVMYDFLAI